MRSLWYLVQMPWMILLWTSVILQKRGIEARWKTENHSIFYLPPGMGVDSVSHEEDWLEYRIRGVNWFGFNTNCYTVHGLWAHDLVYYLDFLTAYGINSLRIPFSYEMVQMMYTSVPSYDCTNQDPFSYHHTVVNNLHRFFYETSIRNITVLLDFHNIHDRITEYPISDGISKEDVFRTWQTVVKEFAQYPHLLGIDLKNEPHGDITWDVWGSFCSELILFLDETVKEYTGLFFIEGVQEKSDGSVWGGSFSQVKQTLPILTSTSLGSRIIFSPHVYGYSVRGSVANEDTDWDFDMWFGNLLDAFPNAIVLGEIGGYFVSEDYQWHQKIRDYLQRHDLHDTYYWCMNPDSGDTGGIFYHDWITPNQEKLEFLRQVQPSPTWNISFASR